MTLGSELSFGQSAAVETATKSVGRLMPVASSGPPVTPPGRMGTGPALALTAQTAKTAAQTKELTLRRTVTRFICSLRPGVLELREAWVYFFDRKARDRSGILEHQLFQRRTDLFVEDAERDLADLRQDLERLHAV